MSDSHGGTSLTQRVGKGNNLRERQRWEEHLYNFIYASMSFVVADGLKELSWKLGDRR